MTTEDPRQLALTTTADEIRQLETAVSIHLHRLRAWTALPDERTDWDLEVVLQELGAAAQALRALRNERDLPF